MPQSGHGLDWTLPATVDPPRICLQIEIPNEFYHIAAFLGQLEQLATAWNWEWDGSYTGRDVSRVWQKIFFDVATQIINGGNCPELAIPIAESDYEMSVCEQLRFQDGKLQGLCCGEWTDIAGQPPGGIATPQPANGAEQPAAGGGCVTYHGTMMGSERWLIPTPVSSGDQISVSNFDGATVEDPDFLWVGPQGLLFFGGAYQPGTGSHIGADPVNTALHQSLIIFIGGNFYTLFPGPFTVPVGVSNEQPYLMLNTSAPGNVIGTVQFDVQVCNNQVGTWSKTWDFTLTPGLWQPESDSLFTNAAVWTPGVGWVQTDQNFSGASWARIVGIQLDPIAFNLDSIVFTFNRTMGHLDATATSGQNLVYDVSVVDAEIWSSLISGDGQHYNGPAPTAIASRLAVLIGCANNDTVQPTDGSCVITKCTITGHGPNPFS